MIFQGCKIARSLSLQVCSHWGKAGGGEFLQVAVREEHASTQPWMRLLARQALHARNQLRTDALRTCKMNCLLISLPAG